MVEMLELPGGDAPSNYRKISADDFSFDAINRKLKQAEADVLSIKASLASDPLTRERFLAQSTLASLRAKQIEDQMRSSREPGMASS